MSIQSIIFIIQAASIPASDFCFTLFSHPYSYLANELRRPPDGYIMQAILMALIVAVMTYISIRFISLSVWLLIKK